MAYVAGVRRILNRLARPVALLVIAAQLLLGFSAFATVQASASTGTHAPCDEMPSAKHDDACPCCPDRGGSMQGCLVMCSLAAAIPPTIVAVVVKPSHAAASIEFPNYLTSLSDPPLKPPPIA
jgi:hypothetical protein